MKVYRLIWPVPDPSTGEIRGPYQGALHEVGLHPRYFHGCYDNGPYRPAPSDPWGAYIYGCRSAGALRRYFGRQFLRKWRAKGGRFLRLTVTRAEPRAMGQVAFRPDDVTFTEVLF